MKLADAATITQGTLHGADVEYDGVSIDSRAVKTDNLFIAVNGPHFDGHDFLEAASKSGAVAAIVSRKVETELPCILVSDTHQALIDLATAHRAQFHIPFVGITGSCGKTTTRALVASILQEVGNVLSSEKSYNNNIGVPLTLLKCTHDHEFAVIEMGANHSGEIAELMKIAKPIVSTITLAAPAHLEGFGSIEGVAAAKSEILEGLPKDGCAVINNDDAFATFWKERVASKRCVTFGVDSDADVMARVIEYNDVGQPSFELNFPEAAIQISMKMMGRHNVQNALAAAAVAYSLDVPIFAIQKGLESCMPVNKRLVSQTGYAGAIVIDDTYNANPASVRAAMQVLSQRQGHSIFVLGDMLELGEEADTFHGMLGTDAKALGIQKLYCFGPHSRCAADAFGSDAYHFEDQAALIRSLKGALTADTTVLVKGSNSMHMDRIAVALVEGEN